MFLYARCPDCCCWCLYHVINYLLLTYMACCTAIVHSCVAASPHRLRIVCHQGRLYLRKNPLLAARMAVYFVCISLMTDGPQGDKSTNPAYRNVATLPIHLINHIPNGLIFTYRRSHAFRYGSQNRCGVVVVVPLYYSTLRHDHILYTIEYRI